MNKKELFVILLGIIIISATIAYTRSLFDYIIIVITVFFVVGANIITKKIIAYNLDADITIKPWSVYRYGFKRKSHFKEPVPMMWLPIIITLLTKGYVWWLAIFSFQIVPKKSRVAKRHGLYRFSEVTEKHIGRIALFGVITNILLAIVMYIIGFEFLTQISILYAVWSLVPISNLDGTKIFFANRAVWGITAIITAILAIVFTSI